VGITIQPGVILFTWVDGDVSTEKRALKRIQHVRKYSIQRGSNGDRERVIKAIQEAIENGEKADIILQGRNCKRNGGGRSTF
jgi:hypothetical protein